MVQPALTHLQGGATSTQSVHTSMADLLYMHMHMYMYIKMWLALGLIKRLDASTLRNLLISEFLDSSTSAFIELQQTRNKTHSVYLQFEHEYNP